MCERFWTLPVEAQAINVWMIQIAAAIGPPPLGALIFEVYIKTDRGTPIFFLTPLAFIALLLRITAIWLILTIATLVAAPLIAAKNRSGAGGRLLIQQTV